MNSKKIGRENSIVDASVNDSEKVIGKFVKFIFGPKEDGFLVGVLESEDDHIVAVGNLIDAQLEKLYTFKGVFVYNEKYGEQFAFETAVTYVPDSAQGIELFLASGIVKGVGEKKATEIVHRFGERTIDIIKWQPHRLLEISGIGEATMKNIVEAVLEEIEMAETYVKLQEIGLSDKVIGKLYKEYGKEAADVVSDNPYTLISDITGIGFGKADEIAKKIGIDNDNPLRVQSGIKHYINLKSKDGHCFISKDEVVEKCCELIEVSQEKIKDEIDNMAFGGEVKIDVIEDVEVIYLMRYYQAEEYTSRKLLDIMFEKPKALGFEIENLIKQTEKEYEIEFSKQQKKGIKESLASGVSIITGGPGTGKTTIIRGIINILKNEGLTMALAAPTGRAAKRISETTGMEASTIHRLLEYTYSEDRDLMYFEKNESNQLKYDVIIVDEFSMVDLMLMESLLKAINSQSRLILVGDVNQLQSVGVGNLLGDMIKSGLIPCYKLEEIFRQAKESAIVVNAHRINGGEYPDLSNKSNDFFFGKRNTEDEALTEIVNLCDSRLEKFFKLDNKIMDVQVLTPTKKGKLGSVFLNQNLQKALNKRAFVKGEPFVKKGDFTYFRGDKVMQIKNNYNIKWISNETMKEGEGVFNGDIGYVHNVDMANQLVDVIFDGNRYVTYPTEKLEELNLAYAMTIHKSQGSEFPVVVIPMVKVSYMLGTRNLIYTGITRGKQGVVMVGTPKVLYNMVDNTNVKYRNSALAIRLNNMYEFYKEED